MTQEDPINPQVQQVVAVRSDNQPGGAIASLGEKSTAVLSSGAGAFFSTMKWMLLIGLIEALAAAWWAEAGSALRGVGAALLVFIPAAVISLLLSGQRAVVAVGTETWRQTGLARKLLDLLLDKVAAGSADSTSASPLATTTAPGRMPIGEACSRLSRAVKEWKESTTASSSLIRRSQTWIAGLIEKVVAAAFQSYVGKGGVDLNEVRQDLSQKIDSLLIERVDRRMTFASIGAVIAITAWATLVGYGLYRLATLP